MSKLVRIKPYNKRRGHVLRRLTFRGYRYDAAQGWYEVSDSLANELKKLKQTSDKYADPAFDVCTRAEAKAIQEEEIGARSMSDVDHARPVEDPHAGALTSADLPQMSSDDEPEDEVDDGPEPEPEPKPAPKPAPKPKAKPKSKGRAKPKPKSSRSK
jgi:hypothetical protein